jgi:hypothetical protein
MQKVGEEVSLHASLQYQSYSNFWVAVRGHDSLTWDGSFARWPSFFYDSKQRRQKSRQEMPAPRG